MSKYIYDIVTSRRSHKAKSEVKSNNIHKYRSYIRLVLCKDQTVATHLQKRKRVKIGPTEVITC